MRENVRVAAQARAVRFAFFRHRAAYPELAYGEPRALEIAVALAAAPSLLLDAPSEGIMPILVEQNVELALEVSDRVCSVDGGAVVYHAPVADLRRDPEIQARYCAV